MSAVTKTPPPPPNRAQAEHAHARAQADATRNIQPQDAPAKATRTRAALSIERRLVLVIISVIAVADKAPRLPAESELGKALAPGRELVKELQAKVIQPIKDRINAVQKELQDAVADVTKIDATVVKDKSQELARLQKKLSRLTAPVVTT